MPRKQSKSKIDQYIIAQVIKMRTEKGMTQEDIAVHLNLSTGYIGHIESHKFRAKYNISHVNELARLFKCSPRDFLPEKPI